MDEKPIDFIKRKFVTADNIIRFDEQFEGYLTTLLERILKKKKATQFYDEFYVCKMPCPGCKSSREDGDPKKWYSNCAGCKGSGIIESYHKFDSSNKCANCGMILSKF